MASRLVTYPEWLANGHYPDGSNPGAKFNPDDKNLRSYYDNYVTTWNGAAEALRVAINVQHGLGSFNSGGGDGDGGGGSARHAPSTVTSEVFSPAYERPGLLDWSRFMPTDSRNILGGGYINPAALASQTGITSGQGQYYQPWAGSGGGLWDYTPPVTSLFSPFGRALNIAGSSALESGGSGGSENPPTGGTPPPGGDGPDRPGADSDTAAFGDKAVVNGVEVPRGFTIYDGEVMTFADAERAKQLAAAEAEFGTESSGLEGGGQVSGNPADKGHSGNF
jgi:hypothetical protein|tara:strand:+ start:4265 stop:5101 length:837 start_codon:yes stop_codon:yes gene_type:complete